MQKIDAKRSALFNKAARRKLGDRDHAVLVEKLSAPPKQNGAAHRDARREALAAAIANRDAERRELTATDRAVDGALARVNAAKLAVEAADRRIQEARDEAAKSLIVREMTGVEPRPLSPGMQEARAARQAAQDDLDAAYQAHATLTRQRSPGNGVGGPSGHLAVAELRVDRAVREVVGHDPVIDAILRRWDEVSYEHASLHKLLDWLSPSMLPEDRRFWRSQWDDTELEIVQAFRQAVKALATDASTPLPKLEMVTPAKAAPPPRDEAPPRPGVNRYGGRIS